MKRSRRQFLPLGGVFIATFSSASYILANTNALIDIGMQGRAVGSHVWFDPIGVRIQPGQSVRWTNLDPGNAHTSTSYHPAKFARPLRIPEKATAWDSDYLLPNETFVVQLTEPGVYDYYCQPHEHAGMVGRIVVGNPPPASWKFPAGAGDVALPQIALDAFPSVVEDIMWKGVVRRASS
jgi:plastocyanin